jgi:2-dehydro-3-deoxyphosphogluconate aldolase / (4S)-4-hydroxy-2-oxoglutarate aldolase
VTADQHQSTVHATLRQLKVISVLLVERVEFVIPLADALIEGGFPIAEVTFRTRHAADAICRIRTEHPNLTVGAGTVLLDEDLRRAVDAGATFGLALGLNRTVAVDAQSRGFQRDDA